MWPPAGVLLALVGLTSASVFLYDPSPSETDGKPYDTSFSNNVGENPNIFSNVESSNGDPNTALPAEETYQNADALLAGTNSNLPISDDGAYQPDAVAPIGGCNAPTSSRTRSKRFDEQCPAETEEQKPVCEIELYPQALCCLGPHLSGYIIVNRCKPYSVFIFYCKSPKYVYCCQEYHEDISVGVICIKAFPGDDDDDDEPLIPPSLDGPYLGDPPGLEAPYLGDPPGLEAPPLDTTLDFPNLPR